MVESLNTLFQSPREHQFFQNPFLFYQKVREAGKIVRWNDYDLMVTADYSTVRNILSDNKFVREPPAGFFSNIPHELLPFYENESRSMLEREPPYHTRLKSSVAPFFTNRRLKQLKHEIEYMCDNLIEKIPKTAEIDLLSNFSQKFPVIVIANILGVPETMASQLVKWSNNMVAMYQARRDNEIEIRAVAATNEFSAYVKTLMKLKKINPTEDLVSYLINANEAKEALKEEEIVSTIILLLNAGHEATVHTITNGVKTILESEFTLIDLIQEPKLLTEEVLRYSTPLHMFTRYCKNEVTLYGRHFNAGEKIGLLLAAANRDPKHFEQPEKFNPFVKRKVNLALGAGLHFCLGAHLARLELEIALKALIKKFPQMKISKTPAYQDNFHFYGLKELFLKL